MFAKRLDAYVGRFCQAFDMPLGIRAFFTVDFYVGYVARRAIRDKNHHVVDACYGIAFGCYACYLDILQKREFLLLA